MKLIHPYGLLALAVVAVIVLAYLLRMPRKKLPVPDASLWRQLNLADRRISQSRRTLVSLALQVLIALTLVAAFVKPYLSASVQPRHEIVLMDLSRSMSARDGAVLEILDNPQPAKASADARLDKAKAELRTLVRGLDFQDRMTVIGVGRRPVVLASGETERAVLERLTESLEAREEKAQFAPACALCVELAKTAEGAHVTVITDGSLEPNAFEALGELPERAGKARIVKVGVNSENLGIVAFRARKSPNSEDDFQAMVTVRSSAAKAATVPVALSLDEHLLDVKPLEVPPGTERTLVFSTPYHVGGVLKAQLFVRDALAADNEALDYLPAPQRMDVALITPKPLSEQELNNYYLAKIIKCDNGVAGGALTADEYTKLAGDKQAVRKMMQAAIFDNWSPASADQVPPCHAIFLNTESPDIPVAVREAAGGRPLIRKWDDGHPLMNHLNLRDLFLQKAKQVQLQEKGVDVVVEMVTSPLILAREIGHRKLVYIGFNPVDSDIQFRKELPFLIFNCFQWFKQGPEPITQVAPGEAVTLPVKDPTWKSMLVLGPKKGQPPERVAVSEDGASASFFDTFRPGVYRYMGENESAPAGGFAVFFADRDEANLKVADTFEAGPEDAQSHVKDNRLEIAGAEEKSAGDWVSRELGTYGLWLAGLLLLIEHYVFHRRIFF
ncbi:MAG: BatA domain-containing protein [Planctomycetes bacterium]|nr:BatA domain-containing protein [Planctomycetota bacterium]